jgi:hypothetical protein
MWPYILTTIAVAAFPLALAGYGGHLATLALPERSKKKRMALAIVWGLAIGGVLIFAASQVTAYRSDKIKDGKNDAFKSTVLDGLNQIIREPDRAKQKNLAAQLKVKVESPIPHSLPHTVAKKDEIPIVPSLSKSLPSYVLGSQHSAIYPEDFYAFVPYVWGFSDQNTYPFQSMMTLKYQSKLRNQPARPLKISYLQGNPSSYSLGLFLERVYGGTGWNVHLIPRTDIAYITGIYLFQDSIEIKHEGVDELRTFAEDNKIPFKFGEQPGVEGGTFEIWVGKGPDTTGQATLASD